MQRWTPAEFAVWLNEPGSAEHDDPAIVVELSSVTRPLEELDHLIEPLAHVVIGVGDPSADPTQAAFCDVIVTEAELPDVLATVRTHPHAAVALALLLRGEASRTVAAGLVAESTTYSMLQSGPEFAAWRRTRPIRHRAEPASPVLVERVGDDLRITLNRPHVRNALNVAMRDALVEALAIAIADPTLRVILTGAGDAFCAGGDLDEFGSRPDPASAHLIRLRRSPALLLHRLADRTVARVHGACVGSGIELAAFAGRVVAHPDTRIALPEVSLGLIPGAGGTVSITRRVGRHRTAWLALSGHTVDATTALAWGLVDEVSA